MPLVKTFHITDISMALSAVAERKKGDAVVVRYDNTTQDIMVISNYWPASGAIEMA